MNDYRLVAKIGEGTFSEVWKAQSLKNGTYFACKKMKQYIESLEEVNNIREIQAMRRLSLHPNILQLHDVALTRAMSFDFPKKKGTGISCLIPRSPSETISLMHAMMEYDPEERITAKHALQHPYFHELRLAEKQTTTVHCTVKCLEGNENNLSPGVVHNLWRIHKGRKRGIPIRHQIPLELPKLNVPTTKKHAGYRKKTLKPVFPTVSVPETGTLPQVSSAQYLGKSKEDKFNLCTLKHEVVSVRKSTDDQR